MRSLTLLTAIVLLFTSICFVAFPVPHPARAALASRQVQGPRTDEVPQSCPVTKPSAHPFVPPAPYPAEPGTGSFWFGTDKLWTNLSNAGRWSGLPHYTPDDPTFRQKLLWWRQGYSPYREPQPKLRITGKRLDSSAPSLLLADDASNGWQQYDQPFMVVGINLPTLGCWKITGNYQEEELSFVIWVTE